MLGMGWAGRRGDARAWLSFLSEFSLLCGGGR
jgi:hypothetical protein